MKSFVLSGEAVKLLSLLELSLSAGSFHLSAVIDYYPSSYLSKNAEKFNLCSEFSGGKCTLIEKKLYWISSNWQFLCCFKSFNLTFCCIISITSNRRLYFDLPLPLSIHTCILHICMNKVLEVSHLYIVFMY